MSAEGPWPMRIAPVGAVTCATVAFREQGRLSVTAVVKATFTLAPGRAMVAAAPDPIVAREKHHGDDPTRSLEAASDLAPYLARAEVLLRGHARAFEGRPVQSLLVRLAMANGELSLLDKRLLVRGYAPFQQMPLTWELAAGGPLAADNPVGIVEQPGREASIVDVSRPNQPAGFGPVARRWPPRAKLLSAVDPRRLEGPVVELPERFRWDYFQAAPADQRLDFLRGDEWLALEGVHPTLARLATCLPGMRAVARVYGIPGEAAGRPLPLVADTLTIDADRGVCSVLWRGHFPLAGDHELASRWIVAGLDSAKKPIAWPSARGAIEPMAAGKPSVARRSNATVGLQASTQEALAAAKATPFVATGAPFAKSRPTEVRESGVGKVDYGLPFVAAASPAAAGASAIVMTAAPVATTPPVPRAAPSRGATVSLPAWGAESRPPSAALPFNPATAAPLEARSGTPTPAVTQEQPPREPAPMAPVVAAELAVVLVRTAAPVDPPLLATATPAKAEGAPRTLGGHFLAAMARAAGPALAGP